MEITSNVKWESGNTTTMYHSSIQDAKLMKLELKEAIWVVDCWVEINGNRIHNAREYRYMWE